MVVLHSHQSRHYHQQGLSRILAKPHEEGKLSWGPCKAVYPNELAEDTTQNAFRSVVAAEGLDQSPPPTAEDIGLVGEDIHSRCIGDLTGDRAELCNRYQLDQSIAGSAINELESALFATCMGRGCYLVASKHDSSWEKYRHCKIPDGLIITYHEVQ